MGESIRVYNKNECVTFKSTKGKHGALSNMAPGYPILIDNITIKTSEALYQALRFPDYPEVQKKILEFPSPISAKKYGRLNVEKSRPDWNKVRFKIMRFCIELKLHQNESLFSKALLATGNLAIVEYTNEDKVWGATDEGYYYEGINALGRLLMELRMKIVENRFELSIPDVDNLKFLGQKITLERINSTPNESSI